MPTVQYIFKGETVTKNMITPKRITSLPHWFKEARKAIPQIPEALFGLYGDNMWTVENPQADVKWVKFDLISRIGERAYIVILRQ